MMPQNFVVCPHSGLASTIEVMDILQLIVVQLRDEIGL